LDIEVWHQTQILTNISFVEMSQRHNYYEDEIDDAEDYEEVGLNLAIGNYGQAGIYEDGSQSTSNPRHSFNSINRTHLMGM
jgi:hypothetical protein